MKSCTTKLNKRIKKNTEQLNNATNSSIILSASAVSLIFFFWQEKSTIFFQVCLILSISCWHTWKKAIFFHVCCYGFSQGWKSLYNTICYMKNRRYYVAMQRYQIYLKFVEKYFINEQNKKVKYLSKQGKICICKIQLWNTNKIISKVQFS